jgi:TetR/AcrR family transcriptional repressor of nem operon
MVLGVEEPGGFGDKRSLFDAALERYDRTVIEPRFAPLEAADAGLDEIRAVLEFYGSQGQGPAAGRGCLLCNTAIELGPRDPNGAGFVERYFERLSRGFHVALVGAHGRGELRADVDPRGEAEFLTASMLGLFVMLRANAPSTRIGDAAAAAVRHLDGLRSAASADTGSTSAD